MNEIELYCKNIHSLRQIAREIGVKAPTSLAKDDLIEAIIRIKEGIDKPSYSNKGRPALEGVDETKTFSSNQRELAIMKDLKLLKEIKKTFSKLVELFNELLKE